MEIRQFTPRKPIARRNRFVREESKPALNTRWKERLIHAVLLVFGIGFGVVVFPFLEKQVNQPVSKVVVKGDFLFLDRREVMAQVPVFQADHLLDVDLAVIQQKLEDMPWVYSAQVSRQWPNVISITVVEQKPIALWNETQLLNQYGEVYERAGKPIPALPVLLGVDGSELDVMQRYMEFSPMLAPLGMKIVRLQQTELMAWEVETDNGMRLRLGTNLAMEKMQRFVFLYQNRLQTEKRRVAVVDLRYNNGAAVSWKS